MKQIVAYLVVILAVVSVVILKPVKKPAEVKKIKINTPVVKISEVKKEQIDFPRQSVTFILGQDHQSGNPYYRHATDFYNLDRESGTEYVVTECRTLQEVRNWLYVHHPGNGKPWGLINLVAHGSQWLGINIPVVKGSGIVTAGRLMKAINDRSFRPLPDSIADSGTEIFIHGCGIGNNQALVKAVSVAFGGRDNRPLVRAARLFEYYSSDISNGRTVGCRRYLAKAWQVFYKTGQAPEREELAAGFSKTYPEAGVDWNDALNRKYPRQAGEVYYSTFTIPLNCLLKYDETDSLPDFSDEKKKMDWLARQQEVSEFLLSTGIPANRFDWQVKKVSYLDEKKVKVPAVLIKASCTVCCVIKPLTADTGRQCHEIEPLVPAVSDTNFYYSCN